jgi:hypothetical protein
MYKKDSKGDLVNAVVIAALGAGVATSFAVARGQSPWTAIGITLFAAVAAVICDRVAWR